MTDVSVNHLNSRLALQLPPELPLGLVFVVGQVENLHKTADLHTTPRTKFELVAKDYSIQCKLSVRAAEESHLADGMRIRAGGHLAFDSHKARYFLLARDIETIASSPAKETKLSDLPTNGNSIHQALGRQALSPILADIKRRAEATRIEQAQLPYWVEKLAPPEVKKELGQIESAKPATAVSSSPSSPLNDTLLSVLSQAMDSKEEIELTSEMLAKLSPTAVTPSSPTLGQTPTHTPPPTTHPSASRPQNLNVAITILVFALILLTILLIVLFIGF